MKDSINCMEALFFNKEEISNGMPSFSVAFLCLTRCDWYLRDR